jgi:hypothetical protein
VLGYTYERQLRTNAGVDTEVLDAGCRGLAGNFAFESGPMPARRPLPTP